MSTTLQQVFDKALGLYQQAIQLAPNDFVLATDYAESYYGIKPLRTQAALAAWTNALAIAHTDAEREWAYDRASKVGRLDKALGEAAARGWTVIDMKRDWRRVFAFDAR
jgi:tetratricopeptide (TPR) repeat protein